ncbi:ABC transporter substrate-binding protein [Dactylosporangium sucinum]|uniref:Leucine-binding protein domain-containing protein n=1 Tax=Dactylosporangium sucinum TaxID=1424081 RepID=A0A917UFR0_9ACTN|nr:ABC transporter substrate-binding protein [Dactylosporangium sucinum]GGM89735.1 hypothetical protein GCM10007977_109750 [Dactylosporangium sucinum]
MNPPPHTEHFRVVAPARAYGVLVALSGLLLAVGLAIPLGLASSAPSTAGAGRSGSGPIELDGDNIGAGSGGRTGTSTADQITDVAQGVTDTTIKVGVMMLDLSAAEPLGLGLPNFSVDLQRAAYQSLFDKINAGGGIKGRAIQPVYTSWDPLTTTGEHSDKAICIHLAKDERVFAILGTNDASRCVGPQYQLPVVAMMPSLEQVYRDSHGLLVSLDPALERTGRNWASILLKAGQVEGRTLGAVAVADGAISQLPVKAAADKLAELGHPLAVLGELDPANSIAQVPALIQKMKSAGVDSVMLGTDFANALRFIALAESQHFYPQYLTSDIGALAANGVLANAGDSFDGAVGFTASAWPAEGQVETPENTACIQQYNETTDAPDVPIGEENAVAIICAVVEVFANAATAAGDALNPRTFVQAVEGLGTIDGLPAVLPGSYGPGKTDYADRLQPVRWSSKTKSYSIDGKPISVN